MSWIFGLDPAHLFFFCTRISMASGLKKDQSNIKSINWYWYVINSRKKYQMWNRSCYSLICDRWWYKTIFNCWDGNNFYGWAISQTLPAGGFKWVENASQFAKDSMKSYNEESDEGCFLEADT